MSRWRSIRRDIKMNVFAILAVILLLSFLVEALTEYIFGQIAEHVAAIEPYSWLIMYVALAVGVGLAYTYDFDLIYLLSNWLGADIPHHSFGVLLTGLSIGRGSNFVHDLWQRFFTKE